MSQSRNRLGSLSFPEVLVAMLLLSGTALFLFQLGIASTKMNRTYGKEDAPTSGLTQAHIPEKLFARMW